jgi:predicted nicotinamide N-methyase
MTAGEDPVGTDRRSRTRFVRDNTKLIAPPLVPEVRLHLAEESLPIWEKTEEELGRLNLPPPFWAFAWAGGQALARHVLDHPSLVAGRRVLDLGSGSGLVAVAAMRAGASSACAADTDVFASAAALLNAEANEVVITVLENDLLDLTPANFDVVLVGDLFYERETSERVFAFMERVAASGALILVGDPRRSYFPIQRFDMVASYDVATTRELEDQEIKRAAVWRLKP